MAKKDLIIAVLLTFSLSVALFQVLPISSQGPGDYDPWYDINDDGKIDMKDVGGVARKFGSSGTNITKASLEYDSGWIDITDKCGRHFNITHNLNTTDIMVGIIGKITLNGGAHQKHLGGTSCTLGWRRTYGGANNDRAFSIIQTSEGGYAVAGSTNSFGAGYEDFWLLKADWTGDVDWSKTYGGPGSDLAWCVVETSDGGYALAGRTSSFGAGKTDFWLVKVDSSGNAQWNQTYGGTDQDYPESLVHTSDGGYAIVGYTISFGAGLWDFWLVKTDSSGNMQWNKTYGGSEYDIARSVIQTDDGGYAITGYTQSFGGADFWLIKTDLSGNTEWNRTYGGSPGFDGAHSVVQTTDKGYAIAGQTSSFGVGDYDFWLVKVDSSGNAQWNQTYGGTDDDEATSVVQTGDGGYAMGGSTGIIGIEEDFLLVKTDSSGNMQWNKTYEEGYAYSMIRASDGAYILAGYTDYPTDSLVIKTEIESGLAWTDSTADTIELYRSSTDTYWNYVRVRIWKIKE